MNLKKLFSEKTGKKQVTKIAEKVIHDNSQFRELMKLALTSDDAVSMRASWTAIHAVAMNKKIITPWISKMVKYIRLPNNPSTKRNFLRILQETVIPEKYQGETFEAGVEVMLSPDESVAAKAFAMTILYNIVKVNPELKRETELIIQELLAINSSAAILSRGKKTLKDLSKI